MAREISGQFMASLEANHKTANASVKMDFSSEYSALENIFKGTQSALKKPSLNVDFVDETGENHIKASADEINLVSTFDKILVKYSEPKIEPNLSEKNKETQSEMTQVIDKIKANAGKWLNFANPNELTASQQKAFKKLLSLTESDIETYLTTYPFLSQTGSATNDGSKYTFDVVMNHDNVVNLIEKIALDFADYKLPNEAKEQLRKELSKTVLTGKVTFDTKDSLYSSFVTEISSEDAPVVMKMNASRHHNKGLSYDIKIHDKDDENGRRILIDFATKPSNKNFAFDGNVKVVMETGAEPLEVASLKGNIEDSVLKNLDFMAGIDLASAKLSYTHKDKLSFEVTQIGQKIVSLNNQFTGDNFAGSLIAHGNQVAQWNVNFEKKAISGLTFIINSLVNALGTQSSESGKPLFVINLGKKDDSDMIRGKMELTPFFSEETLSADVALQFVSEDGKMALTVENLEIPDSDIVVKKVQFSDTSKRTETDKTIEIPTEFISAEEVFGQFKAIKYEDTDEEVLDSDLVEL